MAQRPQSTQRAGYSGTPLVRKLGFKPAMRVYIAHAPDEYWQWLTLPADIRVYQRLNPGLDLLHGFFTRRTALRRFLHQALKYMCRDGMVWVSWPKKSAKVATDITEETIRELALPLGLVDVKVCAVNSTWSALKLVIRKQQR